MGSVFVEPGLKNTSKSLKQKLNCWIQPRDPKDRVTYAKIFLLYGKAGDGKSSLTSYILSKNIIGGNCHALQLRSHIGSLSHTDAWLSVKECFKCQDDNKYQNQIIILDGLDELCVLQKDFNANEFVASIKNNIPNGVKILITSRNYNGYFNKIEPDTYLIIDTIQWTSDKIQEWCKKYTVIHKCREKWCDNFLQIYEKLEDRIKEVLCTPIILYICCVEEIDVEKNNSVVGIYEEAFRNIGNRIYGKRFASKELLNDSEEDYKINWQYTKEIAFQMFLNDTLTTALSGELIDIAKQRTAKICGNKLYEISPKLKRYFGIFHFVSEKNSGIEFAHKTVGEYFTAVKLYEDYFQDLFSDNYSEKETDIKVWRNIFQAFRYKRIPHDIVKYLVDIIEKRLSSYNDTSETLSYSKWRERFFDSYYRGMQKQLLWTMINEPKDYKSEHELLPEQISVAYRNLTWFLITIGFDNSNEITKSQKYKKIWNLILYVMYAWM